MRRPEIWTGRRKNVLQEKPPARDRIFLKESVLKSVRGPPRPLRRTICRLPEEASRLMSGAALMIPAGARIHEYIIPNQCRHVKRRIGVRDRIEGGMGQCH